MLNHSILAHIADNLSQLAQPVKRWVVAYSGGVDSTVLLHGVAEFNKQLTQPLPIVALHINHQLSPHADDWQQHCQQFAHNLDVEFIAETVTVNASGKGIEAAARDERYSVFESVVQMGDCLLLGQHRQDQAETLLLRLLRGAGVRGLSAMAVARPVGQALLVRPFLEINKQDILAYAGANNLMWVEDDSNSRDDFDRNFLRHHVIPLLEKRWSAVWQQLADTVKRMQQSDELLQDLAKIDLQDSGARTERWGFSVSLKSLATLSCARRNNALRYWCEQLGYPVLEESHLEQIQQQFFDSSAVLSSACVSWKGHEFRQFSNRLYAMKALPEFSQNTNLSWSCEGNLSMGAAGTLAFVDSKSSIGLPVANYEIRWRQGGERCTPKDRQHSQTVKKLLQEYGLETWLRDRVPLIYLNEELAAVGDLWVNRNFEPEDNKPAINVSWQIN